MSKIELVSNMRFTLIVILLTFLSCNQDQNSPDNKSCDIVGDWKLCFDLIHGVDLELCGDYQFLQNLPTWTFGRDGDLTLGGVTGYKYEIDSECNSITIDVPDSEVGLKADLILFTDYTMQWSDFQLCPGPCKFLKWDKINNRLLDPKRDKQPDTSGEKDLKFSCNKETNASCPIRGDYIWINAPIHPLTMTNFWDNFVRFQESSVSFFFGHHAGYEVNSDCTILTLRNSTTGVKISEHKIKTLSEDLLIFEDEENCPSEPCQFLRRPEGNSTSAFHRFREKLCNESNCDFNCEEYSCNCPGGKFGAYCQNNLHFVDFPKNNKLYGAAKSNDGNLLLFIDGDNLNGTNNEAYLIKCNFSGEIIWSTPIRDPRSAHKSDQNSMISEADDGTLSLMFYDRSDNVIHTIYLSKAGKIQKQIELKGNRDGRRSPSYSYQKDGNKTVFFSSYGDLIVMDNQGNVFSRITTSHEGVPFSELMVVNSGYVVISVSYRNIHYDKYDKNLNLVDSGTLKVRRDDFIQPVISVSNVSAGKNEIIVTIAPSIDGEGVKYPMKKYTALVFDENLKEKVYLRGINDSENWQDSKTVRVGSGNFIHLNPHRSNFFMEFNSTGVFQYSYMIDYRTYRQENGYEGFIPKHIFEHDNKYYFVGIGTRFVQNVFIAEFNKESLYTYPKCF